MSKNDLKYLNITDLVPNGWNAQEEDDKTFNMLVDNILDDGVISALTVVPIENNKYLILSGEHRWRAARVAGEDTVPCLILLDQKFNQEEVQKFVSIRLNVLQGKLNPAKFLNVYQPMVSKYGKVTVEKFMGFCLVPNTLVSTPFGPKTIDSIQIGDLVYDGLGNIVPVIDKVAMPYDGEMLKFSFSRTNTPLICTPAHHMFAHKRINKRDELLYSDVFETYAEYLEKGDYVQFPILRKNVISDIEINKDYFLNMDSSIPNIIKIDEDLAWLLGIYVAEGYSDPKKYKISFGLHIKEIKIAEKIKEILFKKFLINATIRKATNSENAVEVIANCKPLAKWFIEVCGNNSYTKTIPRFILENTKKLQKIFLKSYTLGDGTVIEKNRQFQCSTVSRRLNNELIQLLANIGYSFSCSYSAPRKTLSRKYSENWSIFYSIKSKNSTPRYKKILLGKIKKIEKTVYTGMVYDLTLEKEHSYIANNIRVGNTDQNIIKKIMKQVKDSLKKTVPDRITPQIENALEEAKEVRDIQTIVQNVFQQSGKTLQNDFLILAHGNQKHIYINMNKNVKKMVDKLIAYSKQQNSNINDVLEPVLTEYVGKKLKELGDKLDNNEKVVENISDSYDPFLEVDNV